MFLPYISSQMADNITLEVIRSHQDDQESLESEHSKGYANAQPQPQPHSQAPAEVDADEKYNRDVPPDGGYGWVCVACCFWINAHTWGINSVSTYPPSDMELD